MVALIAALFALAFGGSAGAITNGTYDGNNHPYVAYLDNGVFACSGTLLSPTVLLTAAHCFSDGPSAFGSNSVTGAPLVRVSFDPNLINTPSAQRVWWWGSYYWDPDFALGSAGGLPGFDTHDVAVVILTSTGCAVPPGRSGTNSCGPVPSGATLGTYGALPAEGQVDSLANNTPIDVVGFGVQNFLNGGGPCDGSCKKVPGNAFTRFFAPTTLIASNDSISDEFIKLHANKGGICSGDSGGPDLLAGKNVVVAVNSFGNGGCASNTYSYRVDTAQALDWIGDTVDEEGGSLP
jgi:Trypsin